MTDIHSCSYYCDRPECVKAQRDELRAELERLRAQEPVAWVVPGDDNANAYGFVDAMAWQEGEFSRPLYAAPPAQPAQRLTDEPQWRPIETAPQDGAQYLACDGKKMWTRNQPPNCYAGDWEWNQNRTQWRGHADGLHPSHWMPLPAAPKV